MTRKIALTITILVSCLMMFNLYTPSARAATIFTSDMPSVFIDPVTIDVTPGEEIMVALKVFNLSDYFYVSNETWEEGEPLPPPGMQFNYSLGSIYGFDIQLEWDTSILNYTSHQVWCPSDTYPGGILYNPVLSLRNDVNTTAGTYWVAYTSMFPAPSFTNPGGNATIAMLNFTVLALPYHSVFNITNSQLAVNPTAGLQQKVPHWVIPADIIPEFPFLMMLPLFLISTFFVALLLKRKTRHL